MLFILAILSKGSHRALRLKYRADKPAVPPAERNKKSEIGSLREPIAYRERVRKEKESERRGEGGRGQ